MTREICWISDILSLFILIYMEPYSKHTTIKNAMVEAIASGRNSVGVEQEADSMDEFCVRKYSRI